MGVAPTRPVPITPDNTFLNAVTTIGVDIYPHDPNPSGTNQAGNPAFVGPLGPQVSQTNTPKYTFSANPSVNAYGGVLSASISKNIETSGPGTFQLLLTPGGPGATGGVNSAISWTSVITPMSLAVIYMARGSSKRIVMVGVVTGIEETQNWTERGVQRVIRLAGEDFSHYFSAFSYYTMSFIGTLSTSGLDLSGNPIGIAGYIFNDFGGTVQATPAAEGAIWYERIMVGNGSTTLPGCMEQTYVTYNGTSLVLKALLGYSFEPFNELGKSMIDGGIFDITNSESDWITKFRTVFPYPWYEFFVTTATANDYTLFTGSVNSIPKGPIANVSTGFGHTGYQISVPGYDSVFPLVISRINPLPWIQLSNVTTSANPLATNAASGVYDDTRWQKLPIYAYNQGFINSTVEYSADEVGNFFGVMTSDIRSASENLGGTPLMTSLETLGAYLDRWSIDTYGFHPKFVPVRWMTNNVTAASPAPVPLDVTFYRQVLLGKLASYYVPTPNMLRGQVTIPLWPSVIPGARFEYIPFKNKIKYTFYVLGVAHNYKFGGPSTTTLLLSRGLPSAVYSDSTVMKDLHLDNTSRVDGNFITRSNSDTVPGLIYINVAERDNLSVTTNPWTVGSPTAITMTAGPSTPSVPGPVTVNAIPNDAILPGSGGLLLSVIFQDAVLRANCPDLDWKLLWAISVYESSAGTNPKAMVVGAPGWSTGPSFGLMQINCGHNGVGGNATTPCQFPGVGTNPITQMVNSYTPTTLTNDNAFNAYVAASLMCENAQRSGGDWMKALELYRGDPDPAVNAQYAFNVWTTYLGL